MVPQETSARVHWLAIGLFVLTAFGLLWLIEIPVYLTGGIASGGQPNPLFFPLTLIGMFSPAIAAVVVTLTVLRPQHAARFLGLVPLRPWGRLIRFALLGFLAPWGIGLLAIGFAALLDVVPISPSADAATLLLTILIASLITAVAAFGEELGWRGFLLPALRPLGTAPALVLHGILWGLWHAPIILIGYNYGTTNPIGVVLMTITTVLIGTLFGWLRMRSGSVYPSSLAHGALNGSSGLLLGGLLPVGADALAASPLGWSGWIVIAVVIGVLVLTRSFRWAPQAASRRTTPTAVAPASAHQ